jgi:hypothetical protein
MVENKKADGSRQGAWIFVYLFDQRYLPAPSTEISSSNERVTPFFVPLILENIGFPAQAGKPKTVL